MIFSGLMIPFLGTTLGAGMVFFMKGSMNQKLEKMLLGFAAGVMIAASVWSLLIPSIEMTEQAGGIAWIPACVGFLLGMIFLLLLDSVIPHLHLDSDKPEGPKTKLGKAAMLVLAVTLHNIPEGMAVGVMYAGFLAGNAQITAASALVLSWHLESQFKTFRKEQLFLCLFAVLVCRKRGLFCMACCPGLLNRWER